MGTVRTIAAEQLTEGGLEHGEGPVWDETDGVLRLVDLFRGDIVTFDPRTRGLARTHVASVAAALRPRTRGGWVVATERGFAVTERGSWELRQVARAFEDPAIRMNDGGCDAAGGFLCGSMAWDHAPGAGSLYRLDPDGTVSIVLTGVTISNGFCLDAGGTRAYYADTPTGRVDVLDVGADGRTLTGRRPFAAIESGAGWPDGLTVDADGAVWVALYGGSAVRRYRPDGALDTVVTVSTPHVTACAFGGAALDELYVTTTTENLDVERDPVAGSLFRVRPGVRGLAPRPFAG